jgi:hypothetical protein
MLGKLRLKPSLVLEVAFILAAWLIAWKVFEAPLAVTVIAIFGAYALVFVYEKWLDGLARRERSEQRRAQRETAAQYRKPDPSAPLRTPSNSGVDEVRQAEAPVTVRPILEQLVAELHERETELPPEVIAAEALRAREQAERERAERERAERERGERERGERDRAERERGERERAEREKAEGEQAEREARERAEEEKPPEPEPEPEPERRSLLAEFAASPGEARHTHMVGGWNVWQLERMMAANMTPDAERDYERSLLLVYLREFADSDGQLPPEFDDLVNESFGDLVRGPAGP